MGSKKESTFINMVIALFIVTGIASTTLGFVYEFTKEPIALAKLNKKLDAIKAVVPTFDNNPDSVKFEIPVEGGDPVMAYPAKLGDKLVGTAIESYTMKGFSGLIKIMVGLKPDGTINNISVLEHKETPGLGTHMKDDWFSGQFIDKNPASFKVKVKKDGGDVDAITAATISSRAYCDALTRAYNAFMNQPKKEEMLLDTTPATDSTIVASTEGGVK
ncbi:MAG: RnfABCDGE type electron transport complex subunit G [Salinivirgaceae bacterium]|nr:RnfABCDGE type electron transport complex subunit G [Salinivirgaceae bacterium]